MLTTGDVAAAEHFGRIPGLESVAARDGQFTLRGRDRNLVTHVIECLSEHGIHVTDFRTELPSFEDVFLKLTGHSIREKERAIAWCAHSSA